MAVDYRIGMLQDYKGKMYPQTVEQAVYVTAYLYDSDGNLLRDDDGLPVTTTTNLKGLIEQLQLKYNLGARDTIYNGEVLIESDGNVIDVVEETVITGVDENGLSIPLVKIHKPLTSIKHVFTDKENGKNWGFYSDYKYNLYINDSTSIVPDVDLSDGNKISKLTFDKANAVLNAFGNDEDLIWRLNIRDGATAIYAIHDMDGVWENGSKVFYTIYMNSDEYDINDLIVYRGDYSTDVEWSNISKDVISYKIDSTNIIKGITNAILDDVSKQTIHNESVELELESTTGESKLTLSNVGTGASNIKYDNDGIFTININKNTQRRFLTGNTNVNGYVQTVRLYRQDGIPLCQGVGDNVEYLDDINILETKIVDNDIYTTIKGLVSISDLKINNLTSDDDIFINNIKSINKDGEWVGDINNTNIVSDNIIFNTISSKTTTNTKDIIYKSLNDLSNIEFNVDVDNILTKTIESTDISTENIDTDNFKSIYETHITSIHVNGEQSAEDCLHIVSTKNTSTIEDDGIYKYSNIKAKSIYLTDADMYSSTNNPSYMKNSGSAEVVSLEVEDGNLSFKRSAPNIKGLTARILNSDGSFTNKKIGFFIPDENEDENEDNVKSGVWYNVSSSAGLEYQATATNNVGSKKWSFLGDVQIYGNLYDKYGNIYSGGEGGSNSYTDKRVEETAKYLIEKIDTKYSKSTYKRQTVTFGDVYLIPDTLNNWIGDVKFLQFDVPILDYNESIICDFYSTTSNHEISYATDELLINGEFRANCRHRVLFERCDDSTGTGTITLVTIGQYTI